MRNFKKFLALVLATLMVASMMVFTAPAASAYAPTGDYADDIALLNAFGVMLGDGVSFGEKENVTRWQMALFIARIVTGETGNAMWEADKSEFFTDVKADHYPGAIDFCAEMGYIKGVGDNKFEPEENITYQDGLTMLVRLLGFETKEMTYPWGYILTARTISTIKNEYLVADINTTNKAPLLREEVANLLAKAIYVDMDASESKTLTLVTAGLKAEDLGDATLVATFNAAINETAFADYGSLKFQPKTGDAIPVKVANSAKSDVLDWNDYIGFTADLVKIKGTIYATMDAVKVVDANVTADNKIKVDGKEFTSFLVYGTAANNVFVANEGTVAKGTLGKVIVCDTNNDGNTTANIVRFAAYNKTTALYVATGVKVYKDSAKGAWVDNTTVDVYYVPHTSNGSNGTTVTTDYTNNYEAVLRTTYSSVLQDRLDSKVVGIGNTGIAGLARPDGVSVGTDKIDKRVEINTSGSSKYADTTSLNVSVIGEIEHAKVTTYGYTKVGNVSFLVVGAPVEVETGKATLSELTATDLKIGETNLTVGFAKANGAVNGWYTSFADVDSFAKTLLGKEVEYKKVDGKIVALKEYKETTTTPTPAKTYVTDPFTATPLFISIKNDTKLTVAADGTIAIDVLDPNTLTTSSIKFNQINGKKVGALVNQFGYEVAKTILGVSAADLTGAVKELLTADGYVFDYSATKAKNTLYLVTVANKADDVYALSTTNNYAIKHVVLGNSVIAAAADKVTSENKDGSVNLGFVTYTGSSLSDKPFYVGTFWTQTEKKAANTPAQYSYASKYLTVTKNTVINVIAKDGVKSFTNLTPGGSDFLNIVDNGLVLSLTNDLVVIVNNDLTIEQIAKFGGAVVAPVEVNGGWYTLTWTTQYVSTTAETVNGKTYFNYTFKDLYNLTTNAKETVVISSENYYSNEAWETSPANAFFGASWINTKDPSEPMIDTTDDDYVTKTKVKRPGKSSDDAAGTLNDLISPTFYDVYFISNERGSEAQASSIYSWGLANGYLVGKLTNLIHNDANTFVVENVKLEATEGVSYAVVDGDETKDYTSVVSWSVFYLNQSVNSKVDEMKSQNFNDGNSGIPGKIIKNSNNGSKAELVLYKVGTDGVATIYTNLSDDYTSVSTSIVDTQAK